MVSRIAANLNFLFTDVPLLDRIGAAANAGFDGVEILFPYDTDPSAIRRACDTAGVALVLFNGPVPDWENGGRGLAALPAAEDEFREGLTRAFDFASTAGAPAMHLMSGNATGDAARKTLIANLRYAAEIAPPGLTLTIEPINSHDMPGYFLNDFDLACDILDQVNAPNVALQFDAYHAQRITGDTLAAWERYGSRAAHIQVADYPGRHEPGTGNIPYNALFSRITAVGYDGAISGEYHPRNTSAQSVSWIDMLRHDERTIA
ncbi:MAG: TIM barrel protein [Rhodobacteraceae bacterium]|nr:TIM barrel protein [Paracoccaceae bacterium]